MTKRLFAFQVKFWLGAALLLFLYGLTYGHWQVALIRNLYFPVAGFILSTTMIQLYALAIFQNRQRTAFLIILPSFAAAIATAAILNPITFALLGIEISLQLFEIWSQDTLYFALFYYVWSLLYFQRLKNRPSDVNNGGTESPVESLTVESLGEIKLLKISDLESIQSSGDYVELNTGSESFLKKETLSNFGKQLPSDIFKRIHRTTIVNKEKVVAVKARGRGIFEISLSSGQVVQSSRSYRAEISELLPEA